MPKREPKEKITNLHEPPASRPHIPSIYGVPKTKKGLLPWSHVTERMSKAMHYWVCTVSPAGHPHSTPVDGLWLDDTLYFGGSTETRRYRYAIANPALSVHLESAMDVLILQGDAFELRSADTVLTQRLAKVSAEKYGYGHKPEDYIAGGTFVFRPREVFAWTQFFKDATRWRLPGNDSGMR
jgi:hypothetical protein